MGNNANDELKKKYKKYKIDIFAKMDRKMAERGILEKKSYNNTDMLEQYSMFVDLISETLNENLPNDKIVKEKNRSMIKESALESIVEPFSFWEDAEEVEQAKKDFQKNYDEMIKQISILKSGDEGEKLLYNRLKIIGDEILILRNAKYILEEDFEVEHDMIIISRVGIFTIEIKNWNSDSCIDKKGYLISKSGQRQNVVEQTMRHKHHLERMLKKYGKESVKVYPIIAWVNPHSNITNEFGHITVCNYNELEFEILNQEKYQGCYDATEREEIYNILKNNVLPANEYPVNINKRVVVDALSKIIAGICAHPQGRLGEKKKESKRLEDGIDIVVKIMDLLEHFLY